MSLRDYVRHKEDCLALFCVHPEECAVTGMMNACGVSAGPWHDHPFKPGKCSCGLDQALAAASETREAVIQKLEQAIRFYDRWYSGLVSGDAGYMAYEVVTAAREALALLQAETKG